MWYCWVTSDESIFLFVEKTVFLFFVHYRVIQLSDFWWNYFLNNFNLFDGLLRRVWWSLLAIATWYFLSFINQSVYFLMTHVHNLRLLKRYQCCVCFINWLRNQCPSEQVSLYIYIHIWNEELKSKTSGKIYMKTKYEIILQCSTDFFFHKVLFLLHFESCQNCMSFANLAAEIHQSFEHWRTMYLWICCFAPVISQRCIKYTLVHSSKLLAYLFSLRLI